MGKICSGQPGTDQWVAARFSVEALFRGLVQQRPRFSDRLAALERGGSERTGKLTCKDLCLTTIGAERKNTLTFQYKLFLGEILCKQESNL